MPSQGGGGRGDGYAAFTLLGHPIHGGLAVVHFAKLVRFAGIKEQTLANRGLAGINVGHDADIAQFCDPVPVHLSACLKQKQGAAAPKPCRDRVG